MRLEEVEEELLLVADHLGKSKVKGNENYENCEPRTSPSLKLISPDSTLYRPI